MKIKFFKYLCNVFSCQLKHIETDQLSDEAKKSLKENTDPEQRVLLVQTIDNNAKVQGVQMFSSQTPMTFHMLAKDEYDDRLILGDPLKFRSSIKE